MGVSDFTCEQFISYIMVRTNKFFMRRWWYLCCPRLPRWIRFLSR